MATLFKNHRLLATAFVISAVVFFSAIGLGLYQSISTSRRMPPLNSAYLPKLKSILDQGQYDLAIPQLRLALELDFASRPDVHNNLGNAYKSTGRFDEAVTEYQKALQFTPDSATAHYNLAHALQYLRRNDEALDHYREALQLKPDYVKAHGNMGGILSNLGRMEEARTHYRTALQLEPDSVEAQNNLAWLLATCHDASIRNGQRAVTLAERAAAGTQYRDASVLDTLSAAYAEMGDYDKAARLQQNAINLAPSVQREDLESRRRLYLSGQPYRDTSANIGPASD